MPKRPDTLEERLAALPPQERAKAERELDALFDEAMTDEQREDLKKKERGESIDSFPLDVDAIVSPPDPEPGAS